jgi:hypothetical protein
MEWMKGFIIPLIEITFIIGILGWVGFYVFKGFYNAWSKSLKYFIKYKIMKRSYPEKTLKWCLDCMDQGIGWYDAKKILMVKMCPDEQINETLWIYNQIIIQLNIEIGGKKNGRNIERCNSKNQTTAELPSTTG